MHDCSSSFTALVKKEGLHITKILRIDVRVSINNRFGPLSCWKAMFKRFGITKCSSLSKGMWQKGDMVKG